MTTFSYVRALGHSRCTGCGGFSAFREPPEKYKPKIFEDEKQLISGILKYREVLKIELGIANLLWNYLNNGMTLVKIRSNLLKRKSKSQLCKEERPLLEYVEELLRSEEDED